MRTEGGVSSLAALPAARSLRSLQLLSGSVNLAVPGFRSASQVMAVPSAFQPDQIARCPALSALTICEVPLEDGWLASFGKLQRLELRGGAQSNLRALAPLLSSGSAAFHLQHLCLTKHKGIADVSPLGRLRSLQTLDLSVCTSIQGVRPLGDCALLRTLILTGCTRLRTVDGLERAAALATLYLTGCASLHNDGVAMLPDCASLTHLHLNKCRGVTDVSRLGHCASLRVLNLRGSGAAVVAPGRDGLQVIFT
jgi:hypothetical protein